MAEYDVVICERCGEDCWNEGALEHWTEHGHAPVVGGKPVFIGLPKRVIRKTYWKRATP